MRRLLGVLCVVVLVPSAPTADTGEPNVKLEWTVQQREGGKLSPGYHIYQLTCVRGLCTLYVISLNQCDEGLNAAFYRKVEYWENLPDESGNSLLEVSAPEVGTLNLSLKTWDFGDVEFKMKIGYDTRSPGLEREVTSFSGAAMKSSTALGKVITWELVPLENDAGFVRLPLDCKVLLPTVVSPSKEQ